MDHYALLEDWADEVRRLKDETLDRFLTEAICRDMLQRMERMKFKRPDLFVQRRGEDYELLTAGLLADYGPAAVMPVLDDDDFFELCLEVRKSRLVRQKMNRLESKDKESQAWVTKSSAFSSVSGVPRTS
jgi:hypothetical protein